MVRRFQAGRMTTVEVRADLPLALLTTLSLATLYLYDREGPNQDIFELATRLEDVVGRPPPAFNQIFGHGFGLRDSLAVLIEPESEALADWPAFVAFLARENEPWYRALCEAAITTGLDFNDKPIPSGGIDLRDQTALDRYARTFTPLDSGTTVEGIGRLLGDPGGALKSMVLTVLNDFWNVLGPEVEDGLDQRLLTALGDMRSRPVASSPARAFQQVTGRSAPASERERLEQSEQIIFLLSPGLGAELSIGYIGNQTVVAFEPASLRVDPSEDGLIGAARVFDALSNPLRLRMLRLLGHKGEMFGLELAEELGAPQATISNHLAALEAAGLVGRRPGGRRIYYSLASAGVNAARELIDELGRLNVSEENL
ncbi:hypothetical protein BH24CHL1_BH24CHL1_03310 [soil metagenome]